ncbi:MAG: helix-turn-helix domain-containing protein [Halarcobacter sp.]
MKIIVKKVDIDKIIFLKEKYNDNICIKDYNKSDSIEVEIKNLLNEDDLINNLDIFISLLNKKKLYKLSNDFYFDENNSVIKGKNSNRTLTNREALFLKNIIMKKNIITYDEMLNLLWKDSDSTTNNAVRLFIKNLKKKIPQNILTNYQGIGYRINL